MKENVVYRTAFPVFDEESIRKILSDMESTLRSGVLTNGLHIKEFERKFAEYVQTEYAVAVNSGTSDLEIALRYFGVKNSEVIVPTNTFVATANAVLFAGGKPVFVDMREDTLCVDPVDVERRLSSKTVGVIVVHVAGLVCPQIQELSRLCKDHGLFLIEDCAHAHGAMFDGVKAGALGDAGCFSFYPTKIMTTGEGGMITTDNSGLAEAARMMRNHGQNSQSLMVTLGYNWRMGEINAILGEHQLENLEFFVNRRNELAQVYNECLLSVEGVSPITKPSGVRHGYYKYTVKLDKGINVEKVSKMLKAEYNIETGHLYYPPIHLHPYYRENFGTGEGTLPIAEDVLPRVLCLPLHVAIAEESVPYITRALDSCIQASKTK
ncbi:MAG: DegT/DnrJ/EryC1/StrS family aminotransferase [Candidatus Bathyarchaeia archaeon]